MEKRLRCQARVRFAPRLAALALGLLALLVAHPASAQVFFASRPNPPFTVGPLFMRAQVRPELGPVDLDVYWSLSIAPHVTGATVEQDLYLLWPGAIVADGSAGAPDPALARSLEARGFTVRAQGRLPLFAISLFRVGRTAPPEQLQETAAFVTVARDGGGLGPSPPATWIRIPWTPRLANPTWLLDLRFRVPGFIQPGDGSWIERAFWGHRHLVSVSFNEVRNPVMFPLYFAHRDRVLHLSEDPAQILIAFSDPDHLKIDEVSPAAASRSVSEYRGKSEVVSLFLERAEGLKPQLLRVKFGYFRGLQAWMPILIPTVFFVLGNLAGPLVVTASKRTARALSARIHVGRHRGGQDARESGVVLARDTLTRLVPGETTEDQARALCGPNVEERESLVDPERRALVYRGRRVVPRRRRTFGWLATVSHWDVEDHEVEIAIERGRVRDVQARVRRSRLAHPEVV